jgi:hypothetical protein
VVWFKVDDGFYTSRKVLSIPRTQRLAAVGLWTMAGNWAARELSDGVVPAYVLDEIGATPKLREALVKARLWLDHTEGGVEFHDWAAYQPTREQIEDERRKTAERQAKWRNRHKSETGDEPVSDGVSNALLTGDSRVSNGAPTRPDPTRPDQSTPKGVGRASRIPEPFRVTAEMREWARREVPLVEVDKATRTFVDYWRAKSGKDATKVDWVATWRNWLRRDGDSKPGAKPAATRKVPANDEWMYR